MHDYQYGELGIKYGASCKNIPELYEKYRAYWDPIMKEHQEKSRYDEINYVMWTPAT